MPELVEDPEIEELTEEMRISFQLILAGRSKDDIELQDKILDAILEETGGYKVERFCEQDMAEFTNMYLQRLGHKHINFVWVGGYIGSWMQFGTPDWVKGYVPTAIAGLERDADRRQARAVRRRRDDGLRQRHPAAAAPPASSSSSATTPPTTSPRWRASGTWRMRSRTPPSIGYPPGKEFLYLQIGWTDEQIWDALAHAKQPQVVSTSSARSRRRSTPTTSATGCTRRCRREIGWAAVDLSCGV